MTHLEWIVIAGLFYSLIVIPWSDRRYRIKHGMLGVRS